MDLDNHKNLLIIKCIKQLAEEKLRDKVKFMIEEEMKKIVGELTESFMDEFKPQVEAYLQMDASSMFERSMNVNIRVSDKHNPNN